MLFKKELGQIPLLEFPQISKEERRKFQYAAAVGFLNLKKSGKILTVDIFDIKSKSLKLRFFSDGKNYLVCSDWTIKDWSKRNPKNMLNNYDIVSTKKDDELVCDFLQAGKCSWKYGNTVGSHIDGFVSVIFMRKRQQVAERKYNLMKKHFDMFPNYPNDLPMYCEKHVFEHTYIYVDKIEKGRRTAVCGHCNRKYKLKKSNSNPGSFGICPKCNMRGKYRGTWASGEIEDKAKICIAHKVDGQIILRWVQVLRKFSGTKYKYEFYDCYRSLYLNDVIYSYAYIHVIYYGWGWFRRKNGTENKEKAHIYTSNLNEVFGNPYYHVDLTAGLENAGKISLTGLLDNLKNIPATEYLFKTGLSVFAANMYAEDLRAGDGFTEVLGISRQYLPLYRKYNIDVYEHKIIRASDLWVNDESFFKFRALKPASADTSDIIDLLEQMSFEKFVNYFAKQKTLLKKRLKFLLMQYKDYISISKSLKVDLSKKSIRFPKNIKESHDLVLERFNKVKHEIEDENFRQATEKLYKGMTEYKKDNYCIIFPQLRSDFIKEGQSLNHCVGSDTYYKNHIAGTSMIFFVRQAKEPDKPYFTLEIDMRELRIRQLYGFGDVSPSADLKKFANEFLKMLKSAQNMSQQTGVANPGGSLIF